MKTKEEIIDGIVARFRSEVQHVYDSGYHRGYDECANGQKYLNATKEIRRRIDNGEIACTYCEYKDRDEDEEPCLGCVHNAVSKFVPSVERLEEQIEWKKTFNG